MPSEYTTPNIGLQVPFYGQGNWNVPIQYDLNLLDLICGGAVRVPAMHIGVLTADNISGVYLPPSIAETPSGAVPGSVYTLSHTPNPVAMLSFQVNGRILRVNIDCTVLGNIVTLNNPTPNEAIVYAQYFYSS
jgi:hypothetical protein